MSTQGIAARLHNLVRRIDAERGPSLHRRAVDVLPLMLQPSSAIEPQHCFQIRAYIKRHPADRLIVRNLRLLDQLQLQRLRIEGDRDDDARLHPRAAHQVVFRHFRGRSVKSRDTSRAPTSACN